MNRIKIVFVVVVNLILQGTFFSRISFIGTYPNISLPVIIGLAIGFGPYIGGFSALIIGLLEDMLLGRVLGVKALIYFVLGFLIGNSNAGINKEDIRTGLILTAFSTFIYMIYTVILSRILQDPIGILYYLKGPIFIEILLNTLLYIPVFYLFKRLFQFPRFRL